MYKYCVITTACDSRQNAEKIIKALFSAKLVSCVQTHNINSTYIWNGGLENADEIMLTIKTKSELYDEVKNCILDNHSYETPEIIQLPIMNGYDGYLEWIEDTVK